MSCPFHRMLRHLKVFAGLPVPEMVEWVDGKPDFRRIDRAKLIKAVNYRLCGICGRRLGLTCYWVGGPLCQRNHYFTDPGMHRECAEESIRLCPFLGGKRVDYRGDLPESGVQPSQEGRPKRMFLMRSVTADMDFRMLSSEMGAAIYAGDHLTTVSEF